MFFSLATHTLMRHTGGKVTEPPPTTSEVFLPTFRPKKKKRGRFILAATSHGK